MPVWIDLLQDELGDWIVIELNGSVEFTSDYQPEGDVFADVAAELARLAATSLAAAAA